MTIIRSAFIAFILTAVATPVVAQTQTVDRFVGPGNILVVENLTLINKQGPNTADHIFYNPFTGVVTVGITKHPQFFGTIGALGVRQTGQPRGDCWGSFQSGVVGATTFTVSDLDGDGLKQEVLLYRASDGKWVEFKLTINDPFITFCDTTDAF